MQQTVGRSWHVVSHSLTAGSKYEVRTPASTASVRGTAFIVNVTKQGTSNFQTTEGTVTASSGGKEVAVKPGFETTVPLGNLPPPDPVKQPDPPAVVQITVDATPNAAVVDANKRTVGVVNGIPIRYAPGSTMEVKDGKLIMTIPNPTL